MFHCLKTLRYSLILPFWLAKPQNLCKADLCPVQIALLILLSKNQCTVVFSSLTKYSSLICLGVQHGL